MACDRDRWTAVAVTGLAGLIVFTATLAASQAEAAKAPPKPAPKPKAKVKPAPPPPVAAKTSSRAAGLTLASKTKYEKMDKRLLAFSSGRGLSETRVDLSPDLPPPGDQGALGSCTGWAVGYGLKSYLAKVAQGWDLVSNDGVNYGHVFSPAFLYNSTRTADGGATLGDALDFIRDRGVSTWADFPYDPEKNVAPPPDALRKQAARWRIKSWQRLDVKVLDIKQQLVQRRPVVIGAEISRDFKDGKLGPGAIWQKAGVPIEAHAMLLVGYDDDKQAFKLMNSWGTGWGNGGFAWVGYDLLPGVVREAYVATDHSPGDAPAPASVAADTASTARKATPMLVGFKIQAGDVLDSITPVFRDQTFQNGALKLSQETRLGKTVGGDGGGAATILRPGAYVVALRIKLGDYFGANHVVSFQADLRDAATGQVEQSPWYGSGSHAQNITAPIEFKARDGSFISGLEGTASSHTSGETLVSSVDIVETRLDWYK